MPIAYRDPISAYMIVDPVILPTSGRTIDRKSIIDRLLRYPFDPWTKLPLKIEDVIPNATLKT
jgi:ubiquitin conjugation factor E4 B